jgi:hypothetical protein
MDDLGVHIQVSPLAAEKKQAAVTAELVVAFWFSRIVKRDGCGPGLCVRGSFLALSIHQGRATPGMGRHTVDP